MTSRGVVATPVIEPARAPAQRSHLTGRCNSQSTATALAIGSFMASLPLRID